MSLKRRLSDYSNKVIAVVMDDGCCLKGKLEDIDDDCLILTDIEETLAHDINWVDTADDVNSIIKGYVEWKEITLPQVIVSLDKILRIWPWEIKKEDKKDVEGSSQAHIYRMKIPDRMAGTIE